MSTSPLLIPGKTRLFGDGSVMGIVRALPNLEAWLEADADSWSGLSDAEYKSLVRRWFEGFLHLVEADASSFRGSRALLAVESRLPANVYLLSGVRVPALANAGGLGPAAYLANELRSIRAELANRLELIVVSENFAWSCVFSHEAGAFVSEQMYEADLGR